MGGLGKIILPPLICAVMALSGSLAAAKTLESVQGVVHDAAGAPVPAATITLQRAGSQSVRTMHADENGGFQFAELPVGSYVITAQAAGLHPTMRHFLLHSGYAAGVNVSIQLQPESAETAGGVARSEGDVKVAAANPIRLLTSHSARTVATRQRANIATSAVAGTNSAADFSIYSPIIAKSPQAFGFNTALPEGPTNNAWILTDGTNATDTRLPLTATDDGTDTTFIATNANGNPGTDFYQSIITGYFVGATAHVYRFTNNAWTLVRTGTVSGYTAVVGSNAIADHTITFDTSGPATKAGDVIWLTHDNVPALPNADDLYYRSADYSTYYPDWQTETSKGWPIGGTAPYTLDTDAPPSDPMGLSAKLTDTKTELQGFTQYTGFFECPNSEVFELGHTYRLGVWLKQQGIADSTVTVSISQFNISHAFTVTNTWQYFTFDFQAPNCLPANSVIVGHRLDFNAPGTLWENGLKLYNIDTAPFSLDPRIVQAWTDYKPSTMRIWSNFGDSSGGYAFWSLDSWLLPEDKGRSNPGIGNYYENRESQGHLPEALREAKQVGANPWLIVSMSLSAEEWGNLVDYLSAPAGVGYASRRPADHPGPYTDDFSSIYLEVGNEEWGTQQTPVNFAYGQWAHYVASSSTAGKAYASLDQLKFVLNGFFLQPSFGSAAAAQAPEARLVDYALYNSGDQTLTGDAYYQSDLIQLPATNKSLIDAMVAQEKIDESNGHPYGLAAYEAGPGQDTPIHQGDTSLAAGVANLDVDLYASLRGFDVINYFLFNLGAGPYSSHSFLTNGLRPHPAWEAMQMRNAYLKGDMVWTVGNSVPATTDGTNLPLIAVYAFHETNEQADIAVISRDLNNSTPVTLHFPGVPTGSANLFTLTGDPRANNDDALNIPIGSQTLNGVTQDYTFNMPPGSVYIFQVPISGPWSTQIPAPGAPTNLAAVADNGKVALTWASVDGSSSYNVKRGLKAGGPYTTISSPTGPGFTDVSVVNGTTYYYVVTAVNVGGESGVSNEVNALPNVATSGLVDTAPPLDGSNTGAWATAPAIPLPHDFNTYTPDTATYKTLWDSNNLYVLATVIDSTPSISTGPYAAFGGDSVEVYFSGTDSKGSSYGPTDFQYAFPYGTNAVLESKHNALTGVVFGQQTIPGGYQLAIAIPWTTLGTTPVAGHQYGFDVMVNDATAPNTRIGKLAWWATYDFTYSNPSLMGPLVLSATGNIPATSTTLALTPSSGITAGQSTTLTAGVTPTAASSNQPAGTVSFSVAGPFGFAKTVKVKLDNSGQAIYNLTTPLKGNYRISAAYSGSAVFGGSVSPSVSASVAGAPTLAELQVSPTTGLVVGQPWTLSALVTTGSGPAVKGGSVTFTAGSFKKTVTVDSNGMATYAGPVPVAGSYSVEATYSGTSVFAGSAAAPFPVTASSGTTVTTLAVTPSSGLAAGAPWTLSATVAATAGSGIPTGSVTFQLAGLHPRTQTVPVNAAGVATLATSLVPLPGSYTLTAVYSGSAKYSSSTSAALPLTVTGKATATTVNLTQSPATNLAAGAPWTLTAVVKALSGTVVPGGTVTFIWDTGTASVSLDASGTAVYTGVVPAVGPHTVYAKYSGASAFGPSASNKLSFTAVGAATSTSLIVTPTGTVTTGQSITLTASVSAGQGTAIPTGAVTFAIGSTTAKVALDSTGTATYTTPAPLPGTYPITASYGGSSLLAASSSATIQESVTGIGTSTTFSVAPASGIVSGQSWVLTAVVTPASGTAIPSGTVSFNTGTGSVSVPLDATGKAVYNGTAPAAGTYSLSATYGGSTTFTGSTSVTVSETVTGAPTTTVLAVAPGVTLTTGQPFTLTATVSSPGQSTAPAGSVIFSIGTTQVIVALGSGGVATYSGIAPAAGAYVVGAAYQGSGTLAPSTSAAASITVVATGTAISIPVPNPSFEADQATFTTPQNWTFASVPGTSTNYAIAGIANYDIPGKDGANFWAPGDFNPATSPSGSTTALLTSANPLGVFAANTAYNLTVSIANPVDGRDPSDKSLGFELLANGVVVASFASTSVAENNAFSDYSLTFYTSSHPELVGQNITVALVYTYLGQYNRNAWFDNVRLTQTYGVTQPLAATSTALSIHPTVTTQITGQPYTLTATVTAATGTDIPTGNVVFSIGSETHTVALDTTGAATFSGNLPAVGSYAISASYQGSPVFTTSTSNTINLTVVPVGSAIPIPVPNNSFELDVATYTTPQNWTFSTLEASADNSSVAQVGNYDIPGKDGVNYWSPGNANPAASPSGSSTAILTTTNSLGTFSANTLYTLTVSIGNPVDGRDPSDKSLGFQLLANGTAAGTAAYTNVPENNAFADYSLTVDTASQPGIVGESITVALIYTYTGQYNRSAWFDNVRLTQKPD